jgi:hypothetical protein
MKQRLHGIAVACMDCGDKQAVWVVLGCFFYCDEVCQEGWLPDEDAFDQPRRADASRCPSSVRPEKIMLHARIPLFGDNPLEPLRHLPGDAERRGVQGSSMPP